MNKKYHIHSDLEDIVIRDMHNKGLNCAKKEDVIKYWSEILNDKRSDSVLKTELPLLRQGNKSS